MHFPDTLQTLSAPPTTPSTPLPRLTPPPRRSLRKSLRSSHIFSAPTPSPPPSHTTSLHAHTPPAPLPSLAHTDKNLLSASNSHIPNSFSSPPVVSKSMKSKNVPNNYFTSPFLHQPSVELLSNSSNDSGSSYSNKKDLTQQPIKKYLNQHKTITPVNNTTSLPPPHQIPCPSIVTLNVTSLSRYTNNQKHVNKTIAKFAKNYDFIFLQETKVLANDHSPFGVLPDHKTIFSNNPLNTGKNAATYTAGVCTAISKKYVKDYVVKTIELPLCLRGHCLVLFISLPGTDFSLKLINLRLLTPDLNKLDVQESMILELHNAIGHQPSKFTVLGGDFNFVERPSDTTSNFKEEARPQWTRLKTALEISDCTSDLHSFFHKPGKESPNTQTWSARLDRFYISHSEADLTVVRPVVTSDVNTIFARGDKGVNSHVPTALHFIPRHKVASKVRRISDSNIESPNFVPYTKMFYDKSLARRPGMSPVEKLRQLSLAMASASDKIFKDKKHELNKVILFQKAVALYRYLSSSCPVDKKVVSMIRGSPLLVLLSRYDGGGWNTTKLKRYINEAFRFAGVPECDEEIRHEGIVATGPVKKVNALTDLKLSLPSTRTKIEALRVGPDRIPSTDPSLIGPVIQDHYGKLWRAADVGGGRPEALDEYLNDYDRKVDPGEILEITLELVQKAIRMAPDTSPGPDGVPFKAFKANLEIASHVILEVCLFLGVRHEAGVMGNFNEATLFLLPKKETLEVDDTRPISVNNTGNRIVARVLFLAVVDASQKLIGDYQRMFLPGRRMTDHLSDINACYYSKVQSDEDYFILFTDNRKAFDSIHHDFIVAALSKQGFPVWFVNSVINLLTGVRVSPSLAPDFSIAIERGVKQGCPLSPLLFILCYDILHFKLSPLENIVVKAAADDLALEAVSIEDTINAFPIIDDFTIASGLGINRDKTVILSAKNHLSEVFAPISQRILSSRWPLVKVVDSHKYLGILFGRKVSVEDIFAAPAKKAADRARSFGAAIRRLDTQRRIMVFNVFITPIFSFVQQFYIMPSPVYREYRSIMHRAITPFGGSAWPYAQLCAPFTSIGFRQPLRDPWVFNIQVSMRKIDFNMISSESDLPWNLDGSFRDRERKSSNWLSPLFRDHSELQLMEFLGPNFLGWDGVSPLPKLDDKSLKMLIIQKLIISYNVGCAASYTSNLGADQLHHLSRRLAKWGAPDVNGLMAHFAKGDKTPAFLITHYIKLLCGADNSDGGRRRKYGPSSSVHPDKCVENPWPCYLCNQGDANLPGDNCTHIFTSCRCVKEAWDGVLNHALGPRDNDWIKFFDSKLSPIFILDFPPAMHGAGYNRRALVMSFCWAIHKIIDQIRMGRCAEEADARAVTLTLSLKNIWAPVKKTKKT